jgi:hypothetical protein
VMLKFMKEWETFIWSKDEVPFLIINSNKYVDLEEKTNILANYILRKKSGLN